MKIKKRGLLLIFLIALVGVFAMQITTFTNLLTEENLTFTGNETIERNLSIYRYADVDSAFINFSGYDVINSLDANGYLDVIGSGNDVSRGIYSNGTFYWITDSDKYVYKYWANGTYTGESFLGSGDSSNAVGGITSNGTFFWLSNDADNVVYKYWMNGTYTNSKIILPSDSVVGFRGILHYKDYLWIIDNKNNKLDKYMKNGTLESSFNIQISGSLVGIGEYDNEFFIIDSTSDGVYRYYENGTYVGVNYSLNENNTSPQGVNILNKEMLVVDVSDDRIYKYNISTLYPTNPSVSIELTSGFSGWCYQESANVSNQTGIDGDCNLNYNGSYEESIAISNNYYRDGNFSTSSNTDFNSININYSKPTNAISAIWKANENNYTIPENCFNQEKLYLKHSHGGTPAFNKLWCYDGNSYIQISLGSINYEEAIYWNIALPESNIWSLEKGKLIENNLFLESFNNSLKEINNIFNESKNITDYMKILKNSELKLGKINISGSEINIINTSDSDFNNTNQENIYFWFYNIYNGEKQYYNNCTSSSNSVIRETSCGTLGENCISSTTTDSNCGSSNIKIGQFSSNYPINCKKNTYDNSEIITGNLTGKYLCLYDNITNDYILLNFTEDNSISNISISISNDTSLTSNVSVWFGNSLIFNQSENFYTTNTTNNFSEEINSYLSICSEDSENYCEVPIITHSDTIGEITLNNLEINATNISKTLDFKNRINTILNNNCQDGTINGTKCIIKFLFNSDTAGILKYSNLNINYIQTPYLKNIQPNSGSASSSSNTFICNSTTDDGTELTNITLKIWNSTGDLVNSTTKNISGTENKTSFNVTFGYSDTYSWNCEVYNNLSLSDSGDTNFTLYVNTLNPAVNLAFPTNGYSTTVKSTSFIYTVQHSTQDIDTCTLYTNENGIWSAKDTDNSTSEIGFNTFSRTLGIGTYKWNILCNTTVGNEGWGLNNYTFTISEESSSGGGGGSTVVIKPANWTMETAIGVTTYDISIPAGTISDKNIQFVNTGETQRTITLSCEDVINNMCQYVSFKEKSFELELLKDTLTRKTFTIDLPKEVEKGKYIFNIIGADQDGSTQFVTVTVTTGGEEILIETLSKLSLKTEDGIPYWIIFTLPFFILLVAVNKLVPKKTRFKFIIVISISTIIPLILVYLF